MSKLLFLTLPLVCVIFATSPAATHAADPLPTVELVNALPPRFIQVTAVDLAKRELRLATRPLNQGVPGLGEQVYVLENADGSSRWKSDAKTSYIYCEPDVVPFDKAKWANPQGKTLAPDAVWKSLKPGTMVVLAEDGKMIDPAYAKLFSNETLILILPVDELPIAFMPHTGGSISTRKAPPAKP